MHLVGMSLFLDGARRGDLLYVQTLLAEDVGRITEANGSGTTALLLSISLGHLPMGTHILNQYYFTVFKPFRYRHPSCKVKHSFSSFLTMI
jgi:hypothetical protein